MKRRRVIQLILAGGAAVVASVSGCKYYSLFKTPDLDSLEQHKSLIAELAETIIPETDTPGARSAHVESFIVKMIRSCTPVQSQNNFLSGLADIESFSRGNFGKSFVDCSVEEKHQALKHSEQEGKPFPGIVGKVEKRVAGESFFMILKRYTVLGYCSSEAGVTKGLAYDYIPGKYVANLPIGPGQKAWATQ